MTLSKLAEKCEKCEYKNNCDYKMKVACGVLVPEINLGVNIADSVADNLMPSLLPNDTIQVCEPYESLNEIKKQIRQQVGLKRF